MRSFYLFGFLLVLAGCVRVPTDEAECGLNATPSLEKTQEVAASSEAMAVGDYPSDLWWEMFEDPHLGCLIEKALVQNPTMKLALTRVEGAEAFARVKKSARLPVLGAATAVDWRYLGINDFFRAYTPVIPASVPEYEMSLDFSYEFDFWGKNRNHYKAALGRAQAVQAEAASARLTISTAVAATYFKLQAMRLKLSFFSEEKALITALLDLTALREEHALDGSIPVISIQEPLTRLNKNILHAEQKVAIQTHMLKILLGESPESAEEIPAVSLSDNYLVPIPSYLSSDLIARRPDLMAQIWLVEAAAHEVGAAKAEFYPSVNLCALAGLDSVFFRKFFRWESRAAQIEPAIHLPIFTGGKLRANLRGKRADFEGAMHQYNELVLQVVKQVADATLVLKTADETLNLQKELVKNFEKVRTLTSNRYIHALDTLLQVIDAEEALLQEKLIEIQHQYERYLAAITLVKTLGGGYMASSLPLEPQ